MKRGSRPPDRLSKLISVPRLTLLVWVLAFVMAATRSVSAQPSEADKVAAEALFDDARRLMRQNKYEEACVKLADSNKLDPGVGTLLNLAKCYRSLGRTASSWSTYREAAASARASGQSDREELARHEAAEIEPSLMRLLIEVPAEVAAQNPQISRDGAAVPSSLWGLAAPVDPGDHVVEAQAPGKLAVTLQVRVNRPGSTESVAVPLLVDDPEASVASDPQPESGAAPPGARDTSPSPRSSRTDLTVTAWVLTGIGVAAGGTAVVFFMKGRAQDNKARDICNSGPDGGGCASDSEQRQHDAYVDKTKSNYLIGYVGLGLAAAAIGTGVTLFLVSGSDSDSALSVAPLLGRSEAGVALQGRF